MAPKNPKEGTELHFLEQMDEELQLLKNTALHGSGEQPVSFE